MQARRCSRARAHSLPRLLSPSEWPQSRSWDRPVRVIEVGERDPPVRNGALRIGRSRLVEDLAGGAIPERMLIAHRAIEAPLRRFVAGRGEMNIAELLVCFSLPQSYLQR